MGESINVGRMSTRRIWSDRITRWVIGLGGASVIGAITLIFAYLLWVVAPILLPGDIDRGLAINVTERDAVLVDISENGEVALRLNRDGIVEFYGAENGAPITGFSLGRRITHAQRVYPLVDVYAAVDEAQNVFFVQARYTVSFNDGTRVLTPSIEYPFPGTTIALPSGSTLADAHWFEDELVIATQSGSDLNLFKFDRVEEGFPLATPSRTDFTLPFEADSVFLGPRNQWLYASSSGGELHIVGLAPFSKPETTASANLGETTALGALLGRYSLVAAYPDGNITQWGLAKSDTGYTVAEIRSFEGSERVERFIMEPRRKGFAGLSDSGTLTLYYPTSNRNVASVATEFSGDDPIAISPRNDALVGAPSGTRIDTFEIDNKHPEISLTTLWGKVWYEGYEEPIYSWQSSSADNDFEPKFSLTPLAFGTLKAAFYALLFAVPIAVMGALYTAYFMSPAMRAWVKPGIEIMAALPTVILGFIGGLWLAPIIEMNLSSVLGILVVLPIGLFFFALLWSQLPDQFSKRFAGWYGLIVAPLIIITVYLAFDVGPYLEDTLFGGDSRAWFREVMGLDYDQRNALVVGIIMGLAVIPAIFSIAEDAIYGVPTHLINGSLALGATPWQTLTRVVLLTASPGIFSAVMIGMGRAVGETMIVLMATGNTPLMDFNIFEGMRTFAANIAVELPEAEVDSSHYRILFLAALVLFMLTFVFNTAAEVVRNRLRERYGSL